ncbi:MAG: hypothetical protein R6U41_03175 [Desulfosalsimonas sp.]|uniref:hypothetical protein n=1 Tax=Desulfosalsimonas sp. TaxID=3073848 RepID=UPI003970E293
MTWPKNSSGESRVEKLIRFFKNMPAKTPDASEADYTGWHQSEEEYQRQQQQWLNQVQERKKHKRPGHDKKRK